MAYTVIGRIRPRPMGAWSAETAYEALDVVMHPDGAKAYMAVRDVPAGAALADGEYWAPVADVSAAVESIADYREQLMCRVRGETETAHGTLVRMAPDAGSLVRAVSHMVPVQAGEGTPSPDNLRAISGRTELKLTRGGKNFISAPGNVELRNAAYSYDAAGGTFTLTKGAESVWGQILFKLEMDAAQFVGRKLTLSCTDASSTYAGDEPRIYVMRQDKSTTINRMSLNTGANSLTFTVPQGVTALYLIIRIDQNKTAPEGTVLTVRGLQLEVGEAATEFEPYASDTFSVNFGMTVYGGSLDWAAGELTVTHGMIDAYAGESLPGAWISDRDAYAAGASPTTGAQVAYALSEPYVVRVAPQLIGAIDGENILYGDAEFNAEWVIPLKASIEARTGALEARSDALDARTGALEARSDALDARTGALESRSDALDTRAGALESRSDALETRVDAFEVALEERTGALDARIDAVTPDDSAVDGKPWTSEKIVEALCPPFETTGSIVQCHPVEHYPLGVVSRIDATQSGTGDASPDNIRPIVGWNSVSVTRCGKNLSEANAFGNVGWAYQNKSIDKLVNSLPAGAYRISFTITLTEFSDKFTSETTPADGLSASIFMYDGSVIMKRFNLVTSEQIYRTDTLPKSKNVSANFVIAEEDAGYRKVIYFYGCGRNTYADGAPNGALGTASVSNLQIELGSTATPYEPYTSDTYTADVPETIYGGELDWNTGVLTVDRAIDVKTSGDIRESSDGTQFVIPAKYNCAIAYYLPCNCMNGFFHGGAFYRANKPDTGYETLTELQEALGDTPIQLCYKLETPYTVQLTPQQIAALTGINTLYTDSGDTAVSGRADPAWLTQTLMERIAALESAATNI